MRLIIDSALSFYQKEQRQLGPEFGDSPALKLSAKRDFTKALQLIEGNTQTNISLKLILLAYVTPPPVWRSMLVNDLPRLSGMNLGELALCFAKLILGSEYSITEVWKSSIHELLQENKSEDKIRILNLTALLYFHKKEFKESVKVFEEIFSLLHDGTCTITPDFKVELLVDSGKILSSQGNTTAAFQKFEAALRIEHETSSDKLRLGIIYAHFGMAMAQVHFQKSYLLLEQSLICLEALPEQFTLDQLEVLRKMRDVAKPDVRNFLELQIHKLQHDLVATSVKQREDKEWKIR